MRIGEYSASENKLDMTVGENIIWNGNYTYHLNLKTQNALRYDGNGV